MPDLDHVREALKSSMTAWATLEVRSDQARVIPAPDPDRLAAQLDRAGVAWSLRWSCDAASPFVVRACLEVAGVRREGLSQAPTLSDAKLAALAEMARLFGVSHGGEGHWVEYDPEDGANVAELEAEGEVEPASEAGQERLRPLPPEPPRDPQMDKARRHIDELLDQLKAVGRGGEATRILMRGYGETVEESRAVYRQLKAILDQVTEADA